MHRLTSTHRWCIVLIVPLALAATTGWAQTVQLPTLRTFGVQTTVSVPDGGTAHLGGVNYGRAWQTQRGTPVLGRLPGVGGPFNRRAMGSNLSSNQAMVSARIIDLNEMDQAVLAEARRMRGTPGVTVDPQAAFLAEHLGRSPDARWDRSSGSATARLPEPLPVTSSDRRTQQLLELGDRALAAGQYELATRYYAAAEHRTAVALGRLMDEG